MALQTMSLIYDQKQRKSGRVVDGSGLENRHTRKGIGGSNPSSSAIQSQDFASLDAFPDISDESAKIRDSRTRLVL